MAMVTRALILTLLSILCVGSCVTASEAGFRFASALWGCQGEVQLHLEGEVEAPDCSERLVRILPAGSRLVVRQGWARVTGPSGDYQLLKKPGATFTVASEDPRLGKWASYFRALLPFANALSRIHGLKGDDSLNLAHLPWLEITNGDRTRISSWRGVMVWHNLPLERPLIVRAWEGDELIYGPEELIAPAFDLARLEDRNPEAVTLELLLARSFLLPSPEYLAMSAPRLLNLPGKPIAVVLQTSFERVSPATLEEDEELLARARAELPPPALASLAIDRGRLDLLREALVDVGPAEELPPFWRILASGMEIHGDGSVLTGYQEPVPESCDLEADDVELLWSCFWELLGPAVVPEIPPSSPRTAWKLVEQLHRIAPEGWRPWIARAQMEMHQGRYGKAKDAVAKAESRCGEVQECQAAVDGLGYLAAVAYVSDFARVVSADVAVFHDPDLVDDGPRTQRAQEAIARVELRLKSPAELWYVAARVRLARADTEWLRLFTRYEEHRNELIANFTQEARSVISGDEPELSPALEFLLWSVAPDRRVSSSVFDELLTSAAWLLRAEFLVAPEGGLAAANLAPLVIGSSNTWLVVFGILPFDEVSRFKASEWQEQSRGTPLNIRLRILALSTIEAFDQGHRDEALYQSNELYGFEDRQLPLDIQSAAVLLQARSALGADNEHLLLNFLDKAEVCCHDAPGASEAFLEAQVQLGMRVGYSTGDARTGRHLIESSIDQAIDSEFYGLVFLHMEVTAKMLSDLGELELAFNICERRSAELYEILKDPQWSKQVSESEDNAQMILRSLQSRGRVAASSLDVHAIYSLVGLAATEDQFTEREERAVGRCRRANELMGKGDHLECLSSDFVGSLLWRVKANMFDVESALSLAEKSGDATAFAYLALAKENLQALEVLEKRLINFHDSLHAEIAKGSQADPLEIKTQRLIILLERRTYLWWCAVLGAGKRCQDEYALWEHDPLSVMLSQRQPWRRTILQAHLYERQEQFPEALTIYLKARQEILQQNERTGHAHYTPDQARVLVDTFDGASRVHLELSQSASTLTALDNSDSKAWLAPRGLRAAEPPTLPSLASITRPLGPKSTLLVIGGIGSAARTDIWLYSDSAGLRHRTFQTEPSELLVLEALVKNKATPTLEEVTTWLAEEIPQGAPVAIVGSSKIRGARIHLLPVEGKPLALRNPLTFASSLRDLAQAQSQLQDSSDRRHYAVGTPVREETAILDLHDRPLEKDILASLVPENHFLWDKDARREKVLEWLPQASSIHFSVHGVVDHLDSSRTGLVMGDGTILSARDLETVPNLPGTLIILSSCQSGVWNTPAMARSTGALSSVFLQKGASSVVSTTQSVEAPVAQTWMQVFHEALTRGETPMQAAHHAYHQTRADHPSPDDWAAFTIVGAGTGRFNASGEKPELSLPFHGSKR